MKGLILKDFYSLKMYVRTLIVMVVIYAMLGFFSESASMFSSLVAVVSMILPITSFTYDKYYKWEEYALSLPLRRNQIVLAKYIFTALILLFAFVLTVLLSIAMTYFNEHTLTPQQIWEAGMTNYYTTGILLLPPAILLPVMFRAWPRTRDASRSLSCWGRSACWPWRPRSSCRSLYPALRRRWRIRFPMNGQLLQC